jgi:hypothetical protein
VFADIYLPIKDPMNCQVNYVSFEFHALTNSPECLIHFRKLGNAGAHI